MKATRMVKLKTTLSESLWESFKTIAAQRGISLSALGRLAMQDWIASHKIAAHEATKANEVAS